MDKKTPCLSEDDPALWEKLKEHILDWHDDDDKPIFCKKCGKKAVMQINMNWICPELYDIPLKYFHPG